MSERVDLKRWLKKYENPKAAYNDIEVAVNSYKNLQCLQDLYELSDGTTKELVHLTGTIPVRYSGSGYNIPICMWILDTYPKNGPICYLKSIANKTIKVFGNVDPNGKIYLPYLHDWDANYSNLMGLIQIMIVIFGETFPFLSDNANNLTAFPSNSSMSNFGISFPQQYYPSSSNFPPSSSSSFPLGLLTKTLDPTNPMLAEDNAAFATAGTSSSEGIRTITDEYRRQFLLTAIEEKLKRKMKEKYEQAQAELETLIKTQEELKKGKLELDNIFIKLKKDENDLCKNITLLKTQEQELIEGIEKLDQKSNLDVDDAVTPATPLYKQLLNAFAEEAGLGDAIYYIGEALRKSVIDLEVFLKQVRTLSRQQFMLRALILKCREKAGLLV